LISRNKIQLESHQLVENDLKLNEIETKYKMTFILEFMLIIKLLS